jgi:chaperonin GroES
MVNMKELQPINQNVLLELLEDNSEQKTVSGIIILILPKKNRKLPKWWPSAISKMLK